VYGVLLGRIDSIASKDDADNEERKEPCMPQTQILPFSNGRAGFASLRMWFCEFFGQPFLDKSRVSTAGMAVMRLRTLSDSAMDLVGTSEEKDGTEVSPRGSPFRSSQHCTCSRHPSTHAQITRTAARAAHSEECAKVERDDKTSRSGRIEGR
jgi:hypothetical protein